MNSHSDLAWGSVFLCVCVPVHLVHMKPAYTVPGYMLTLKQTAKKWKEVAHLQMVGSSFQSPRKSNTWRSGSLLSLPMETETNNVSGPNKIFTILPLTFHKTL